jgi:glycosyltransferase involved in cell wall biosynthesis
MADPLITVLITNYNYGRYVGAAIESALAQSYEPVEVVVVDDGSVDNSKTVISRYGSAVTPVYKHNHGQASAFNVGVSRSDGAFIAFLDADDLLLPDTIERVAEAFAREPDTGIVQCRVEIADETGTPLGSYIPAAHVRMPNGDLRMHLTDFANTSWWAPTSGISIASRVLEIVLPLPEEEYRVSADYVLGRASALCAPITSLEDVGSYYRLHGSNRYYLADIDVSRMRAEAMRVTTAQRYLHDFALRIGLEGYPSNPQSMRNAMFLTQRMALLKVGSPSDALPGDTPLRVAFAGSAAALRRPDVTFPIKLLHVLWFVVMVLVPRALARWLVRKYLFRSGQPGLSRIMRSPEWRRTRRRPHAPNSSASHTSSEAATRDHWPV